MSSERVHIVFNKYMKKNFTMEFTFKFKVHPKIHYDRNIISNLACKTFDINCY